MSWVTSPAATELEQHVLDWFADLLGLPESFRSAGPGGGVVQDSSSGANLVALLAALHRASGGGTVRSGVRPDEYTVYVSAETHSSMEKAVDRKSTRLNSSHANISYAVFCLKKKR